MLGFRRLGIVVTAVLVGSALTLVSSSAGQPAGGDVRVILELAGPPALERNGWERAKQRADVLEASHRSLVGQARAKGLAVEAVDDLTAAYNGLVVDVPKNQVAELATLPGVRAVHRDGTVTAALKVSVPLVRAPEVWEQRDPGGLPTKGAGVVVSILDTGIDYTHPDLGGGFGPAHRVVAGHDFVNDDGDPMDDNGHGTHVAGIVGAAGGVTGVAPEVSFTAYKVLGQGGSGDVSDVLAALDEAVAPDNPHRADVVNLSLVAPGDGSDELAQAAETVVDAGVVVVAAAGNAGPGSQTIASPGSAPRVLTVGASTSGVTVPAARLLSPAPEQDLHALRLEFSANPGPARLELDVVDLGEGTPGSYEPSAVAGKAVLIQSTFGDLEKALAAEASGARAAFFYIPDTWGFLPEGFRPLDPTAARRPPAPEEHAFAAGIADGRLETLVAMFIPGAKAVALQDALAESGARVAITAADATDQVVSFSSRGPSGLFGPKPELVAPGVEIWSTQVGGGHLRLSGTSMATPHVAGAAALLRQLHPSWSAQTTMAALTSSARALADAPILAGGAGRLDALAASRVGVVALTRTLPFGLADTSEKTIERSVPLVLQNLTGARRIARLSAREARGSDARVSLKPGAVSIPAGGTATVTARISLKTPRGDSDESGAVTVDVAGASDLRVPYSLAVRHLTLHVSPDPVPAETETSIFVSSQAVLAAPPTVRVDCPGAPPAELTAEPFVTRVWRARADVGRPAVCEVTARGRADGRYGSPALDGATAFEVADEARQSSSSWRAIGPNGEGGHFAFDGGDGDHLAVVAAVSPSLFVTDDGGTSWREIRTMPLAGGVPRDVAVDPRNANRIYVAVNGEAADPTYNGRLLLTEDGGRTWRILPAPDARFEGIDLAPSGALAIAGGAGLFVTADDFATRAQLPAPWTLIFDLHWIGADLYLGTTSGLQRFRDAAGQDPIGPELLFEPPDLPWVGRVAGDAETILADSFFGGLHSSADGGQTFSKLFDPFSSFVDLELIGEDIYGVTFGGAFIGRSRGTSWEAWGDPNEATVEADILPRPGGGLFVSAPGGGIFAAESPATYRRIGVPGVDVFDLAVATDPSGRPAVVAGGLNDTYRKVLPPPGSGDDGGLEWGLASEGFIGVTTRFLAVSPDDANVVWKVRADAFLTFGIFRSDDGGSTWTRKSSPSEFAHALHVHPADPDQVFVSYSSLTGAGLVVTRDDGTTWRKLDQGRVFFALAGDPTDPSRIWAGDFEGLWLSEDGGLHFRRVFDSPVSAIAVDPTDARHLVVGGRSLFVSRNGGKSFDEADSSRLDLQISDLVFAGDRGRTIFASTRAFFDELGVRVGGRGVLRSDDGGRDWSSYNRGLANRDVTSLALSPEGDQLFAGTLGGSVHALELDND